MRRGFLLALLMVLAALSTGQAAAAGKGGRLVVYANNSDDDTLKVGLYIDGLYRRGKWVPSEASRYVTYYDLDAGEHEVALAWQDPDVCASSYQTSKRVEIVGGETKKVVLTAGRNSEPVKCSVKQLPCELVVTVKNLDDDDLWVGLLLDKYSKVKYIRSGSSASYGTYRLDMGEHSVRLDWYEPDAYKTVKKAETINLESEGKIKKTFYVEKYTILEQEYTGFLKNM